MRCDASYDDCIIEGMLESDKNKYFASKLRIFANDVNKNVNIIVGSSPKSSYRLIKRTLNSTIKCIESSKNGDISGFKVNSELERLVDIFKLMFKSFFRDYTTSLMAILSAFDDFLSNCSNKSIFNGYAAYIKFKKFCYSEIKGTRVFTYKLIKFKDKASSYYNLVNTKDIGFEGHLMAINKYWDNIQFIVNTNGFGGMHNFFTNSTCVHE